MQYNAVISLAVIKSNWDIHKKDYIENFVPFLSHLIKIHSLNELSTDKIQPLFREVFGINVPIHSIKLILVRAKKRGYLKKYQGVYTPIRERLHEDNFYEIYNRFKREHTKLISSLCKFSINQFNTKWTQENAEKALLMYLKKYDITLLLGYSHQQEITIKPEKFPPNAKFIVNRFIQNIFEKEPELFKYFEDIIKGHIIANALFLADITRFSKRFKNVDFYLDTEIILQLLVLENEVNQKASEELINLIYTEQGNLKIFRHTWDEVMGVLEALRRILSDPTHYTIYRHSIYDLIDKGYSSSDVDLLISRLDKKLSLSHINVVDPPGYNFSLPIDEEELENKLSESIGYYSENALQRDVSSISAICRLRKGRRSTNIESCGSILVTPNFSLAKTSTEYFKQVFPNTRVPPCITDYYLTTLLWLKQPKLVDKHISKAIIASAYASVNPNEKLWRRYISEVKKLYSNNTISQDDYYMLLYSIEVRSMLMDITQGEDAKLQEGSVYEILQKVKGEIQKEATEKYLNEKKKHEETKRMLREKERKEKMIKDRVEYWASKIGKLVSVITEIFFVVLGGIVILYSSLSLKMKVSTIPFLFIILASGCIIIYILSFLNVWIGINIKGITRKIEIWVKNKSENFLNKFLSISKEKLLR